MLGSSGLLARGRVLAGRRVEALLGAGSSGEVYRVRAADGGLQALKVIHPAIAASSAGRARFRRECEISATLHHPHVVAVLGHGEDLPDGAPLGTAPLLWSAMELVQGGTAADLVPRGRPARTWRPDVALVLQVLHQLARGLDHVHRQDVLHRDVKPANALLSLRPRPRAVLTDFGIAQVLDDARPLARNGRVPGSLPYAAPEVLQAQQLTPAADQYSLGCAAVELLTGAPPYPLGTAFAVADAHLSRVPPRVSARRAFVPPALDPVVARVLAKDPAERYDGCEEFIGALRGAFGLAQHPPPHRA